MFSFQSNVVCNLLDMIFNEKIEEHRNIIESIFEKFCFSKPNCRLASKGFSLNELWLSYMIATSRGSNNERSWHLKVLLIANKKRLTVQKNAKSLVL